MFATLIYVAHVFGNILKILYLLAEYHSHRVKDIKLKRIMKPLHKRQTTPKGAWPSGQ